LKRYEDVALGDVARIGAAALVFTMIALGLLAAPGPASTFLEPLPISRHGQHYDVALGVVICFAVICWALSIGIFVSSPRQHVRYEAWMKRWNRSVEPKDGRVRVWPDPTSADYDVPIWRYWRRRGR